MERTIGTLLIIAFVFSFCMMIRSFIKNFRAETRLNELYRRREERENRRLRLIAEKPEYVIFMSQLVELKATIRPIGMFDSLEEIIKPKEYDCASVGYSNYLFKDGKWYEIVDDRPYKFKGV